MVDFTFATGIRLPTRMAEELVSARFTALQLRITLYLLAQRRRQCSDSVGLSRRQRLEVLARGVPVSQTAMANGFGMFASGRLRGALRYNDRPQCHDIEGFAAIGSGADHADAQIRFAQYHRQMALQETLSLTYFAKRRGETAPGVGVTTDMFIRAANRQWFEISADWLVAFDQEYQEYVRAERAALASAVESVNRVIEGKLGLIRSPASAQQADAVTAQPSVNDPQQ